MTAELGRQGVEILLAPQSEESAEPSGTPLHHGLLCDYFAHVEAERTVPLGEDACRTARRRPTLLIILAELCALKGIGERWALCVHGEHWTQHSETDGTKPPKNEISQMAP